MQIFCKFILALFIASSLSACLEVEEDNSAVTAALQEQNQTLQEQNELLQENQAIPASVTLVGRVVDLGSGESVEASLRVKLGLTWTDSVTTNSDGEFELTGVQPNSDFLLEVSSPSNAFLTRAFYSTSPFGSDGVALENMGNLGVSEGVARSFSLLNSETNEPVTNLEMVAYSHVSGLFSPPDVDAYAHTSTYNEASGTYDIVLPENINVSLRTSLYIDDDAMVAYEPVNNQYLSGEDLYISSSALDMTSIILLEPTNFQTEITLAIAVLDQQQSPVADLILSVTDRANGTLESTYSEETGRYEITAQINERIIINVPAFSAEDVNYEASQIQISQSSDRFSISYSNSQSSSFSHDLTAETISIYTAPDTLQESSNVALISYTSEIKNDGVYTLLYSGAIDVPEDAVTLVQRNVINVIRGNDNADDLVPNGFTLIDVDDENIDITVNVSDNDSRVSIEPTLALESDRDYQYAISSIYEKDTMREVLPYPQTKSFTTDLVGTFDISSIVADNGNFTNFGSPITASNTAGEVSTTSDQDSRVSLYLPPEVKTLNYLKLTLRLTNDDGVLSLQDSDYVVVNDNSSNFSQYYAVTLAENEQVTYNSNIIRGTALTEGYWITRSTGVYFSDHTATKTQTLSFEYELERSDGAVETGTIELAVQ